VAKDQDAIDFTDNDITQLANFPLSLRLHSLYCARNRISVIQTTLARSIPNLTTLVLTENALSELADLGPLGDFKKLTHLSLLDNPVAAKEVRSQDPAVDEVTPLTPKQNYRYFLIHLAPTLRFIDFQRVRDSERSQARDLFGTRSEPTELAQTVYAQRSSRSFAPSASVNGTAGALANRAG